jgi:hypothetical protein
MTHSLRPWLLVASVFVCTEGLGQTMYRCGNKYQDRPCDAGQKSRAVGSTGVDSGPAPGTAPAAGAGSAGAVRSAAQCAQLGQDALKIVWSREGGATQERLESEAKTGRERNFVRDVYRRRGSAPQVQAAVEADCIAEREKEAQAAALEAAAARLRGEQREAGSGSPIPIESRPPPSAAEVQAAEQQRARAAADRDAESKKRVCARFNASMDDLRARERRGGSVGTMDAMREERRSLQSEMSSNGC